MFEEEKGRGGFLFGMKMGRGRIDRLKDEVRSRLTEIDRFEKGNVFE